MVATFLDKASGGQYYEKCFCKAEVGKWAQTGKIWRCLKQMNMIS